MPNIPQSELPAPKSWDDFEDIVADVYVRLWNDPHARRYGRSGQRQQGVDIYGQPERLGGGYAGIQCKRYAVGTLTSKIVEKEIDKAEAFRPSLAEFLIATTDRRDAPLQEAVREINEQRRGAGTFPVHIVFWEDLCTILARPDFRDILLKHYGDWLNEIEPIVACPHQIPDPPPTFQGRRQALHELTAAIREGGVTISGVRGLGAIGKTALAFALAHRLRDHYPDGDLLVELDGTTSPVAPADAMARVIGAFRPRAEIPARESELSGLYRSVLHDKQALLLFVHAANAYLAELSEEGEA